MSTVSRVWTAVAAVLVLFVAGCGPTYPNCKKDKHCHEGEYCVNNRCQQCRDNGDCPEGQECAAGACREIPGYCRDSADCAEGQICRNRRCGPCMTNSDCPSGQVCMDGLCGEAECHSTEDCPAGLSCINYRCRSDQTSSSMLGPGDCVLEPMYFAFDSAEVSSEMRRVMQNNYECLVKRGGRVTLEGHCDPRGTTEYNMALGERRARMVQKLLTAAGLDRGQLRVISKGKEEATGTNEAGWARDRRVEFK